jgi:hypothetical protein
VLVKDLIAQCVRSFANTQDDIEEPIRLFLSDELRYNILESMAIHCAPYIFISVYMYSQVQGKRERDRLYAEANAATKQSETEATGGE